MAKAIKTYIGGVHGLVRYAVRTDGALFASYQARTRWGYKWGPWQRKGNVDPDNLPGHIQSGFSQCFPTNQYNHFNPRLPNE